MEISPGQNRDVTLTISRVGMPQDEPIFLIAEGGSQGENSLLDRTPDGAVSITGDTRPFTEATTTVNVRVAPDASVTGGVQTLSFPIRKQNSKYPTPGRAFVDVFVR
ncbi:hypothetical protein ACI3L1_10310 [Deinococcus sp. SM5_A1]|uniref:hypothetical protein n=1 Tax=Deinococcus sp. SM5_A1 TaxID=3379094 RepID=UPI00385A3BAC